MFERKYLSDPISLKISETYTKQIKKAHCIPQRPKDVIVSEIPTKKYDFENKESPACTRYTLQRNTVSKLIMKYLID